MTNDIRLDVQRFILEQDLDGLCDYIRGLQYNAFHVGLHYPQPSTKTPASLPSPNIPSTNGDS